jgi:SAM-dependent methyltransferase
MPSEPLPPFNRALVSHAREFRHPAYAARRAELQALSDELAGAGLRHRRDHQRDWENCHVLLGLEAAFGGLPERLLDVGGGNSVVATYLARRGVDVTVLDVDRGALADLTHNASALGLADRLRGVWGGLGRWPLDDGRFPALLSISVIEGILRSRRAEHFAEMRRVLAPGGHLFLTFDYGPGARFVSDPPTTPEEVERDLVAASGLERQGAPFPAPAFEDALGPPIKALVPTLDGQDLRAIEYTFGALHLARPAQRHPTG